MPIVHIEILKGRTLDQKRALVEKVTEAISESVTCSKEAVRIIINEFEEENYSAGGVLFSDK